MQRNQTKKVFETEKSVEIFFTAARRHLFSIYRVTGLD